MKKVIALVLCMMFLMTATFQVVAIKSIPVKSIKLNSVSVSLKVGETFVLKTTYTPANTSQKMLSYTTNNKNIAKIEANGKITAVNPGKTTITVLTPNKAVSAKCQVTVAALVAPVAKLAKPDLLEVTRCLHFGDATDNPDLKEEFMKLFQKETGIKLKVNAPPRSNYMEKVNLGITSGELKGMVNLFDTGNILKAIDDGSILPLDDYLKDNAKWNAMPEAYKNCFKFHGKIYAIPAGYTGNYFVRSIRQDWLDNLGMKVPTNMNELYEMAKAFTEKDPDKNGKNDTCGFTSSMYWNLGDIFQSLGCRLDPISEGPIAWDPNEGVYRDAMLKPEMANALEYIKKLYKNKYLDNEFITDGGSKMRSKLWTGKAGSSYYWAMHGYGQAMTEMKKTLPDARFVELTGIKDVVTKNVNGRNSGGFIYVLIKGTKQPKETVNAFVNTFLFEKKTHFMVRYGIEGKTYKFEDGKVIILKDPKTGKPYPGAGLSDMMPEFDLAKMPVCVEGTAEEMKASLDLTNIKEKMTAEGFKDGTLFNVPSPIYDSPVSNEYANRRGDIVKIFNELTVKGIMGEMPINEVLAQYRAKVKALGGDYILQEANRAIGKTPTQKY